jgi:CHAT domain-containing protein/Flp pilus assembly protein TadD
MLEIISKICRKSLPLLVLFFLCTSIYAQPDYKETLAKQLFDQGILLDDKETLQSFQEALYKFQTARRLYQEIGDKDGEGKAAYQSAYMFQRLGRRAEALENYTQAFKLFQATANRLYQAKTLNFMGTIYSTLGQKKTAFDLYNTSLQIFYEIDAFQEAIPTINNVGSMYQELGDTKNALFYFNLALPYVREIGDKGREGMILLNIGDVYSDSGEYQKAIDILKKSLPLHQFAKNSNGEVRTLNQIGVAYLRAKQSKESIPFLTKAVAINGSRFKNDEALSLHYLLLAYKSTGDRSLAIFYGKQAVNKYQNLRQGIQSLDAQTQKRYLKSIENTYRQLADLLIEQGNFAQAEQVLRMLKEEEYFDFVRRDSNETINLEQRVNLSEKEKNLLERYTSLANRLSEIEQEIETLEKRKNSLSESEKNRYEKLEIELGSVKLALTQFLEKELIVEFGKTKTEEIEYDRSLQANLRKWGEGTVTLYTVVTEDRYRVILTTPDVQVAGKTEISAIELNKKIFAYRDALQNIEIDPRPLGKELYDILIKPIEKDLQTANAKTLVWSLDGTLRYIPISTLSPDGKTYLIENYRSVITTPKTRNDVSDLDAEWLALGVGVSEPQTVKNPENPKEEIEFSPIPGTKDELMTIIQDENDPSEKGILKGRRFLDKDFTIKSLSESLSVKGEHNKRKFTAVHIASHFQLGNNWINSFLLLGNGEILTLENLKNSPEINFGDVELVTLSACDTAYTTDSNGKEIDSLASVIQAKNGKAVLAALWAVVDESTPLLMSEFYRLRKENPKMTKAEALQKVQKAFVTGELKPSAEYIKKLDDYYKTIEKNADKSAFKFEKNAPFAHPYFWSPFVLLGNWR